MPMFAANALAVLANGNSDTQLQIAEEGAIAPLVQTIRAAADGTLAAATAPLAVAMAAAQD